MVFFQALNELGTCRPASFEGLSPIPWTAIVQWFDRSSEFLPEDFNGFVQIIRQLDEAQLKWADENKPKSKASMKDQAPQTKPTRNRPKKTRNKRRWGHG